MALDDLTALLGLHGVRYRIHEHEPVMTVTDSRERLPFPFEQYLKTLVFRAGERWVLAAMAGRDRIDYRRLAVAVGVPRAAIRAADPAEVEGATGCAPGAICPIPLRPGVAALLDETAARMDTVFTGCTRADRTLEIRIRDLVAVATPQIVPLRRDDYATG